MSDSIKLYDGETGFVYNAIQMHLENCLIDKRNDEENFREEALLEDEDYLHNLKTIQVLERVLKRFYE